MNERDLIWAVKAIDQASPALANVAKSMTNLHHSAFQARTEMGQFEKTTRNAGAGLSGFGSKLSELWAVLGKLWTILKKAGGAVGEFLSFIIGLAAKCLAAVGVVWALVAAMLALGGAMAVTGLGLAAKEAISFELSMARVRGVTGSTKAEIVSLGNVLRQYAKTSTFTPTQLGQASYFLASAGMNPTQIKASMQGINALAESFNQELAPAAELVVATLAQYGFQASDAARVSNVFAAANGKSLATFEKLTDSMRYAGPIAGALNVRFEQTVAALALLYNAGLRGEQAGTMLRMMMLRLITPSADVSETLLKYGLTMRDVNPSVIGIAGSIGKLVQANLSAADATKLFGSETVAAYMSIRAQGGAAALNSMEAALTGTNAAFAQQAIQADTVAHKWSFLKSSLGELALTFGMPLLEPMKKALDGASDFINKLTETKEVRGLAAGIGGVFDMAADAIVVKLKWLSANWETVWNSIWKFLKPVLTGIAGVFGAIIGAFSYLVKQAQAHGGMLAQLWDFIVQLHVTAASFIVRALLTIEDMVGKLATSGTWRGLAEAIFEMVKMILGSMERMVADFAREMGRMLLIVGTLLAALAIVFPPAAALAIAVLGTSAAFSALGIAAGTAQNAMSGLKMDDVAGDFDAAMKRIGAALGTSDFGAQWAKSWNDPKIRGAAEDAGKMVSAAFGKTPPWGGGAGNSPFAGLFGAMGEGQQAAMTGADALLTKIEKYRDAIKDAMTGGGGPGLGGNAEAMAQGMKLPEELVAKYDELLAKFDDIIGPMVALKDYLAHLKDGTEALKASVDAQKSALDDNKKALEENTKVIEESLKAGWEKMTGGSLKQWATAGEARTLWEQMKPSTLSRLVPGAEDMTDKQLTAALGGNQEYMRAVRRAVANMNAGELRRTAKTGYDLSGKEMLDAWRKPQEASLLSSEKQLTAADRQLKAAELQVQAVSALLANLGETRRLQGLLAATVAMRLEMTRLGDPGRAAKLGEVERALQGDLAGRTTDNAARAAKAGVPLPGSAPSDAQLDYAAGSMKPLGFLQSTPGLKKDFGFVTDTAFDFPADTIGKAVKAASAGGTVPPGYHRTLSPFAPTAHDQSRPITPYNPAPGSGVGLDMDHLLRTTRIVTNAVPPGAKYGAAGLLPGILSSGVKLDAYALDALMGTGQFAKHAAAAGGLIQGEGVPREAISHAVRLGGYPHPAVSTWDTPGTAQMITAQNWQKAYTRNNGMFAELPTPNLLNPGRHAGQAYSDPQYGINITIHAPGGDPKQVKAAVLDGLSEWEGTRSAHQARATGLDQR